MLDAARAASIELARADEGIVQLARDLRKYRIQLKLEDQDFNA